MTDLFFKNRFLSLNKPTTGIYYPGEVAASGYMTAVRMYSATSNPGVTNDASDTAGIAQTFQVGDLWRNTSALTIYQCNDSTVKLEK